MGYYPEILFVRLLHCKLFPTPRALHNAEKVNKMFQVNANSFATFMSSKNYKKMQNILLYLGMR